jgi:single-stranded DNA-binding protein
MLVLVTGTLLRDPEIKESKAGKPYGRLIIRDGTGDDTIFARVTAFEGPVLDAIRSLHSGAAVSAQGRAKLSTYEKGGQWKASLDMVAEQVIAPGSKQRRDADRNDSLDENIPF